MAQAKPQGNPPRARLELARQAMLPVKLGPLAQVKPTQVKPTLAFWAVARRNRARVRLERLLAPGCLVQELIKLDQTKLIPERRARASKGQACWVPGSLAQGNRILGQPERVYWGLAHQAPARRAIRLPAMSLPACWGQEPLEPERRALPLLGC